MICKSLEDGLYARDKREKICKSLEDGLCEG